MRLQRKRSFMLTGLFLFSLLFLAQSMHSGEKERKTSVEETVDTSIGENSPLLHADENLDAEESEKLPEYPIDFSSLLAINPETIAWIMIPGTRIDYPIVYTDNNETYLHTSFEGKESAQGAIYLDCESKPDLSGKHSIFYGHHMRNGSMFKDLVNFKEEDFFKKHRDIYLYLPDREVKLRTIAAVWCDSDGERRRTTFSGEEEFDTYIKTMTERCSFRELPERTVPALYSFVTCSYETSDARTIVYAVENETTYFPSEK